MYVRLAIVSTVLSCIFSPAGEARSGLPAIRQAQVGVSCGWIGVAVSPMTRAFADSLGMAEPYGAIFGEPKPGSPAAHEGIQAGDVVTAINGMPIMRSSDFAGMIAAYAPNTRLDLDTFRDGQMIVVKVVLGSGKCPSQQRGGGLNLRFFGT
jgi:serine protease Do